jgi:hypothetical protein
MTARASRYVAGAAAGLALTASLAGCKTDAGGNDASGDGGGKTARGVHLTAAQEALDKASKKTGDITSFRATLATDSAVSGTSTKMKGNLAFRLKPEIAMRFNVPSITVGSRTTQGFQEVLVGDGVYMKIPALAKQAGKPWVGFSLSKLGKSTGIDVKGLENQGQQADPALNARMLTASKDVHKVGQETVRGVSTTHYEGTFTLADALAKLGTDQRDEAQKIFGQAGFDKLNFNLWIDGRQLPRRINMTTPAGSKLQMNTTMDYTAFNVPVAIKAPPKSEVADGSKLTPPGSGGDSGNVPG